MCGSNNNPSSSIPIISSRRAHAGIAKYNLPHISGSFFLKFELTSATDHPWRPVAPERNGAPFIISERNTTSRTMTFRHLSLHAIVIIPIVHLSFAVVTDYDNARFLADSNKATRGNKGWSVDEGWSVGGFGNWGSRKTQGWRVSHTSSPTWPVGWNTGVTGRPIIPRFPSMDGAPSDRHPRSLFRSSRFSIGSLLYCLSLSLSFNDWNYISISGQPRCFGTHIAGYSAKIRCERSVALWNIDWKCENFCRV